MWWTQSKHGTNDSFFSENEPKKKLLSINNSEAKANSQKVNKIHAPIPNENENKPEVQLIEKETAYLFLEMETFALYLLLLMRPNLDPFIFVV